MTTYFGDSAPVARRYHAATNQTLETVQSDDFRPLASIKPRPYKLYVSAESIDPGPPAAHSRIHALDAISSAHDTGQDSAAVTGSFLASILHFSAGVIQTTSYFGEVQRFRAASCAGALYHVDVYPVTGPILGLEAGVYQFGPQDGLLRRLRAGDFRSALIEACGQEPQVQHAETLLVLTTTYWRSSWKYRARAYRHAFWDSGTILANALGVAQAHGLTAHVILGFDDGRVNRLLGLDSEHETAVAVLALGHTDTATPATPRILPLSLKTVPYSAYEIPEPLIVEAQRASNLHSAEEVVAWRTAAGPPGLSNDEPSPASEVDDSLCIESVIRRRGSAHHFAREPITLEQLDAILYASTRAIPSDVVGTVNTPHAWLYLIVNAVTGMESGAYAYDPTDHAMETLSLGNFRGDAGHLDLSQALGAEAAVNMYVLTDLNGTLSTLGERGYRVAQTEAGILGGRIYLASYALGLAATGGTFYDDDVVNFFSPHATGKSTMFLVAVGHRAQMELIQETRGA